MGRRKLGDSRTRLRLEAEKSIDAALRMIRRRTHRRYDQIRLQLRAALERVEKLEEQ